MHSGLICIVFCLYVCLWLDQIHISWIIALESWNLVRYFTLRLAPLLWTFTVFYFAHQFKLIEGSNQKQVGSLQRQVAFLFLFLFFLKDELY